MDLIRRVVIFLGITIIAIVVTYFVAFNDFEKETLPILSPRDINPELVDSSLHNRGIGTEGIYHQISPFNLVDQHGLEVSENDIENKVIVVDFFFVSCGSICPIMTKNLKRVHDFYKKNHNVLILSHTVWPEMDSVSVLNNYANEHDANYETWRFLTGDKKELYRLARKDYMVVPAINDPNYQHGSEADFIHTENVVLIDKKKRIRGYYDGTDENAMKKLVSDIGKLL
tara:strand:- start:1527 stop:2210 length:684 start_codon:yes stop_codon:yes gene_type:complete